MVRLPNLLSQYEYAPLSQEDKPDERELVLMVFAKNNDLEGHLFAIRRYLIFIDREVGGQGLRNICWEATGKLDGKEQ